MKLVCYPRLDDRPVDPVLKFGVLRRRAIEPANLAAIPVENESGGGFDDKAVSQSGFGVYIDSNYFKASGALCREAVQKRLHHATVPAPLGPELCKEQLRPVAHLLVITCRRDIDRIAEHFQEGSALTADRMVR